MCEHPDEEGSHIDDSQETGKSSHKRNLSNGTPNGSPLRTSKRQKSTKNLKELSSDESEAEEDPKAAPTNAKQGKKAASKATSKAAKAVKGDPDEAEAKENKVPRRARKTKEEKEAESMPLAARTKGLRMFVGAHVSAAKGVFNSIHNSEHIGGNAIALFLKSQRKWDNPPCKITFGTSSIKHILPHGSYLVNLAVNDKAKAKQAYDSFLDDLRRCEALGIKLYNFHPSPEALTRLAAALTKALEETSTVIPVLETMCGHGNTIGGYFSEFKEILARIPEVHHSRIGICIDTCHSFAAGYDLVSPDGFKAFLSEFDEVIGLKYLRALHLNDSKTPFGSKRDLHANIGTGFLGLRAFHNVMNEPRFEDMPMVLETPIDEGKTGEDFGVWAREIKLLESLIGMDAEGEEFKALEAKLSAEGKETRKKQQALFDKKVEMEKKRRQKLAKEKGRRAYWI
ncbi:DNA-(apurinic or apyrimidinic site) lyase 1 [Penicillium chermesinum]|uniref:Apurinic-apyrimidinic endonuclease 1 n=1 Tax=Penicillium chermesinum TaxID=63820 RepID=A0A9W9N9H0_9EURO|nr:DNA-(apurinic or apyrimidinic site) lyase 1 [Penicillium chermesinum]KAJ5214928.1 DNA-(apurinic or apyrimidinic site) lyase 1 [Penicillium chermesinum]